MSEPNEDESRSFAAEIARYSEADWLRFAIQAIPVVGSALDLLLTSGHRRTMQERVRYLLAALQADVARMDVDKVDRSFVSTEEFHDLLVTAMRASVGTRHREKIRINARILAGALRADLPRDDPELHLELIQDLSPSDVTVLREIITQQREPPGPSDDNVLVWASNRGWDTLVSAASRSGIRDLSYVLHRLQRAGCIKEINGGYFDYIGGTYLLSDAARSLVKWLDTRGGFPTEADVASVRATVEVD